MSLLHLFECLTGLTAVANLLFMALHTCQLCKHGKGHDSETQLDSPALKGHFHVVEKKR